MTADRNVPSAVNASSAAVVVAVAAAADAGGSHDASLASAQAGPQRPACALPGTCLPEKGRLTPADARRRRRA